MVQQAHGPGWRHFLSLSTAESNRVVIYGGFLLLTWLLLGNIGLVLLGVVTGTQLHSWWERFRPAASDASRHQQLGIEIVRRLMSIQSTQRPKTPPSGPSDVDELIAHYSDFKPATGAALAVAIDEVVEQYVEWWYRPIAPVTTSFAAKCRESLVRFVRSISLHLSRKRPADLFLHFLTNSSSVVIVFLGELSSAFGAEAGNPSLTADSLRSYLTSHPESNLANLLSTERQQELLRLMADDILKMFLEAELYKCDLTKTFLSEALCNLVLTPLVESCSTPEYINGWIVYLLEEGEPEIMNALDAGLEQAHVDKDQSARPSTPAEQGATTRKSLANVQNLGHSHKKSRNEMEMEEAMRQVKRINDMIVAENARRAPGLMADDTVDSSKSASVSMEGCISKSNICNKDRPRFSAEGSNIAPSTGPLGHSLHDSHSSHRHAAKRNTSEGDSLKGQSVGETEPPYLAPRTLRRAAVSVVDDFNANEGKTFRSKPAKEYLLQIEPADLQHQGWMVARKYADFETLHEVLARISWVSGATSFRAKYPDLPAWKGRSKKSLQDDLEHYLRHALQHDSLADSEAMKKFLDKSRGSESTPSTTNFALPNPAVFGAVSKGVLGVLANAPKGVAGGGKAVLDGVTGVFGTSGRKKSTERTTQRRASDVNGVDFAYSPLHPRSSHSDDKSNTVVFPVVESNESRSEETPTVTTSTSDGVFTSSQISRSEDNAITCEQPSPTFAAECDSRCGYVTEQASRLKPLGGECRGASFLSRSDSLGSALSSDQEYDAQEVSGPALVTGKLPTGLPQHSPISNDEVMMAIELLFAVINEMYSLSSVWSIRKALLNAARSFLLRPGNPNIDYIREIIQKWVGETIADDALARYINTLRETCLSPSESAVHVNQTLDEDKERLRQRAREIFVHNGMPQALASVMGTAATAEALGRVFDSLQVQPICQGLVFVVILQALKIIVQ